MSSPSCHCIHGNCLCPKLALVVFAKRDWNGLVWDHSVAVEGSPSRQPHPGRDDWYWCLGGRRGIWIDPIVALRHE
jgi:hypothetical protein